MYFYILTFDVKYKTVNKNCYSHKACTQLFILLSLNPKGCVCGGWGGGGGAKMPGGQEIVCQFSQGHAMVTKILDYL